MYMEKGNGYNYSVKKGKSMDEDGLTNSFFKFIQSCVGCCSNGANTIHHLPVQVLIGNP